MKLPVMSIEGKELRTVEVDETVFGIVPNQAVLHQAFVAQRNNQRGGNAKTKTRAEVAGSTRKMRMQKYTGRARAGSNRAPTRVGGGIAFGPRPRSYAQDLPKKMRRLAIRSCLSGKVADGQLVVVDQLSFDAPKTQEVTRILQNVGFMRSALLVTATPDRIVLASVKNLHKTKVLPANYLNVVDMLNHAGILITEDAIRVAEGLWGKEATNSKAGPRRPAATAKTPSGAPKVKASKPEVEAAVEPTAVEAKVETAKPTPGPKATAPTAGKAAGAKPKTTRKTAAKPKTTRKTAAKPAAASEDKPKRAPRAKKTGEGE